MRLKNRKKSAAAIKSMKVGTDELKDLIKGAVKEAMGEEDDTGDDGSDAAAALDGITAEDIDVAKATKRIVMQNIVIALGIKSVFLVLGALGMAGMWEAVFGDVGVTIIAVLNAMRILKK